MNEMTTCNHASNVQLYHDCELSAEMRAQVDAHLATCAPCRQLLAELKQVSQLIVAAPLPAMPRGVETRLQQAWWRRGGGRTARDHAVRQLTGWLTTAAAAVLTIGLLRMPTPTPTAEGRVDPWEMEAAQTESPDLARDDGNSAQLVQVAQWMSQDLSLNERR